MALRTGTTVALALVLAGLAAAGCRGQRVWAGIELSSDGKVAFLAAEEPTCGCIGVRNVSSVEIRLFGNFQSIVTGEARLAPGEKLRFKFDWASSRLEEYYEVRVYDVVGQPLRLADVLGVEGIDPWRECPKATCDYGPLRLDLGESLRDN